MPFFVYILRTSKGTFYTGQTNNLEKRLKEHKSRSVRSSKYMQSFDSFELVFYEEYLTRNDAMKREWQLKKWSRKKKEVLVQKNYSPERLKGVEG